VWVRILGSGAGGGFPQWNCNCPNCRAARDGSLPAQTRTQSSLAVSADYERWFVFNASPDIRSQIEAFPALWPRGTARQTPIQAVVLSDAELDHTLGLLLLREGRRLRVYSTPWVHTALTEWNPTLRTLAAFAVVDWQPVRLNEALRLCAVDGTDSGLYCQAFSAGSRKQLTFAPAESAGHPEASVGYRITDARTGRCVVYLPALETFNAGVQANLSAGCECLLVDGTCWADDEMARLGIAGKTARQMGHLPLAGDGGSLELLAGLGIARTILVHINNTNPVLIEDSPERQAVEARGIEVAVDGLEVEI
jgi:pyrroloquinoline quinone biosynthesis protein B